MIDFLCITTAKNLSSEYRRNVAENVVLLLGGEWSREKGMQGYTATWRHASGAWVGFDGDDAQGVHVFLPGDALRLFGDAVEDVLASYEWDCTRIDIAVDIKDKCVDDVLADGVDIVSRSREETLMDKLKGKGAGGKTLYIGSLRGSRALVRIYDKHAEAGLDYKLLRVEVQLRREWAKLAYRLWRSGVDMRSFLLKHIDFRDKNSNNHPSRRKRLDWWENALDSGNLMKIVYHTGETIVQTVERTASWLHRQVATSLAKMQLVFGESFIRGLLYAGHSKLDDWNYYNELGERFALV